MSAYDEKLREFVALIDLYIYKLSGDADLSGLLANVPTSAITHEHDQANNTRLSPLIDQVEHQIIAGILNDLDLNVGLKAIIDLARHLPSILALSHQADEPSLLYSCIRLRLLVHRWLDATGLDYGAASGQANGINQAPFIEHLSDLRFNMRQIAFGTLRTLKQLDKSATEASQKESIEQLRDQAQEMLAHCDQTRSFMEMHGIKLKVRLPDG